MPPSPAKKDDQSLAEVERLRDYIINLEEKVRRT